MVTRILRVLFVSALVLTGAFICSAQSADNRGSLVVKPGEEDNERPLSVRETIEKLRIEKEKKDFEKMLERGDEALKITAELEKAFAQNGKLTGSELSKLGAVEKLAKQIRNELGGDDDDGEGEMETKTPASSSVGDVIKALKCLDDVPDG